MDYINQVLTKSYYMAEIEVRKLLRDPTEIARARVERHGGNGGDGRGNDRHDVRSRVR